MTNPELETAINAIVCDVFDVDDESKISGQTVASDVEGWDSLGHVRLLLAIERKFGFRWREDEVKGLENVNDLYRRVGEKMNSA